MSDPGDRRPSVRDLVLRLRRADVAAGDTRPAAAPDAVAALAACIRTDDRALAGDLARTWLRAAEQAVAGTAPADRDRDALALLARVLGVPDGWFTDAGPVDGALAVAADAARRGVTSYGPCRGILPGSGVGAVHSRILGELEPDGGRTPG